MPRSTISLRRTTAPLLVLLGSALLAAEAADAFTEQDIEAAAAAIEPLGPLVAQLADDALRGRDNESAGSAAAQDLVEGWLAEVATAPVPGEDGDGYRQPFFSYFGSGTNLLGIVRGGELPDEYVVVGAHYDHLGSSCEGVEPGDEICNGATDNAAGVAAVIGIGRALDALPNPPRRSVLLALWDAEEDGLLGSRHYTQNDPVAPLSSTLAVVNLDILGANLAPSLRETSFAVGAETGGTLLGELLDAALAAESLGTRRLSYAFGGGLSDDASFVERAVPAVFMSDFVGACYHTTGDELSVVDFDKLRHQARTAFRLVLGLTETQSAPGFDYGFDFPRASFPDAITLSEMFDDLQSDLGLFEPARQLELEYARATVEAVILAGEEAFDSAAARTLIRAERDMSAALTSLPCDPAIVPEPDAALLGAAALSCLHALRSRTPHSARRTHHSRSGSC